MKNIILNPYKVKWSIVLTEKNLTKKSITQLAKIGYSTNGDTCIQRHSASEEACMQLQSQAINILNMNSFGGVAFIITDKQFGMAKTTYYGAALPANTMHQLVLKDGNRVTSIPVTVTQIKQSTKF